ncbi:MAG: HEPN domain-containing protein [Thermoproteales archaeon]|nr:HEPN domain-containing protein [Thermoproteales archaeon]
MSIQGFDIPWEFLTFSKEVLECLSKKMSECKVTASQGLIRTAISRTYFASFLVARRATSLEEYRSRDIHKKVVEELEKMNLKDIADKLSALRRQRNLADYEVYRTFDVKKLEFSIKIAENIIDILRRQFPCSSSFYR